jgi:hypothetical protein
MHTGMMYATIGVLIPLIDMHTGMMYATIDVLIAPHRHAGMMYATIGVLLIPPLIDMHTAM